MSTEANSSQTVDELAYVIGRLEQAAQFPSFRIQHDDLEKLVAVLKRTEAANPAVALLRALVERSDRSFACGGCTSQRKDGVGPRLHMPDCLTEAARRYLNSLDK